MNDVSEKLRFICSTIRRKPASLSDYIPLLQHAADEIERLEERIRELTEKRAA